MNIHINPPRTQTVAETALNELYVSKMSALPGNPDVTRARDEAIDALRTNGLPTRRIESWHYTDLRNLLRSVPEGSEVSLDPLEALAAGSHLLRIVDGEAETGKIAGATVTSISAKLEDGTFARALVARGSDDTIGQINSGLVSDGYHVAIPDGAVIDAPVEIQVIAGQASHTRLAIKAGKNSKATFIERHVGGDAFVSAITNMVVEDGADITLIIDQERGAGAVHLGQFNAHVGVGSKLTLFIMNAGSKLVRQEVHVAVKGDAADFKLRAVNLIGGEAHIDVTMTLVHDALDSTSTEVIRNVVTGKGRGVFQGQIRVAPGAQKTDAKMACNTLLLSDEGEFSAKPELEIFADDVQCGHGATVREVEGQHLFYLMARGIPENLARGLLVKAFVAEIIEELENEHLVEALEGRLATWLEANA